VHPEAPGPARRRRTRTILFVTAGVAVAVGVLAAVVLGLRSLGEALVGGSCTTTTAVVAQTVPSVERRFDLAELDYACSRDLASVVSDQAYLSFTAPRRFASARALAAAVRAELVRAGWQPRAGRRRLTLRRDGRTYTAIVTASSIAPPLAIVRLDNLDPRSNEGASDVDDPLPEKHLSDRQRLRYVTVPAFVPSFVPPGYASWASPFVVDLHDVEIELRGGADVAPSLRSSAPPAGFSMRDCDIFTARSRGDRCTLFGTTTSGLRVYIARDASQRDGLATNPVALVEGGTLVTLLYGHNHRYVRPRLRRGDVLRIFDSLRARNDPAQR